MVLYLNNFSLNFRLRAANAIKVCVRDVVPSFSRRFLDGINPNLCATSVCRY
jgi:hypothetical protein